MYVAIYIDLQRPPWSVPNDFHAEEVMQFAEVIHLVVRLDAIDNSFDGSAASSGDHTVVHVRENVDRMSIPISECRFYFASSPLFLVLVSLFKLGLGLCFSFLWELLLL